MHDELARRIDVVAEDRSHGAAELARMCLQLLADGARRLPAADPLELQDALNQVADDLVASRPSMASIANLLASWRESCERKRTSTLHEQRTVAAESALELISASRTATQEAAALAAAALSNCRTVMTYSYSSTVCEAITLLDPEVSIVFSEARPGCEGYRLAEQLSLSGRRGTMVTDAQLGHALTHVDAVLVGADSVLADGSVINKAGTLLVATACAHFQRPFYCCCESHKILVADMPRPALERMSPEELDAPGWPGITIDNVYFDVTPPELVSSCITESGMRRFDGYRKQQ